MGWLFLSTKQIRKLLQKDLVKKSLATKMSLLLVMLTPSFLISCKRVKVEVKNGHMIVTSYYWNGRLKEQKSYTKDSVLDGTTRSFYKMDR